MSYWMRYDFNDYISVTVDLCRSEDGTISREPPSLPDGDPTLLIDFRLRMRKVNGGTVTFISFYAATGPDQISQVVCDSYGHGPWYKLRTWNPSMEATAVEECLTTNNLTKIEIIKWAIARYAEDALRI